MIYVERTTSMLEDPAPFYGAIDRPRYVPSHAGWNGKEMIAGKSWHKIQRGKCDEIRPVPEEYVTDLEKIRAERVALRKRLDELRAEERDLLAIAFSRSRPVTVAEVKEMAEGTAKP